MIDGPPQRSCAAFPPYARRCRAATLTLAPLRVARGMAAPASATAPPLARRGAACAGGWPFLAPPSRLRRPRLGSGRNSLAFARSPLPRPRASATTRACALRAKRPAWGAAANRAPSCRAGISAARFRAPKRGGLGTRAWISCLYGSFTLSLRDRSLNKFCFGSNSMFRSLGVGLK